MVETPLVNADVEVGAEVVQILESAKIKLKVAMWVYLDDQGIWRLLLVSPEFDPDKYREVSRVNSILKTAGMDWRRIPPIMLKGLGDRSIRELRKRVRIYPYSEGDRLQKFYIDHNWIEDSYIYRLK